MPDYQPISCDLYDWLEIAGCDLYDWLEIAASWQLPVNLTSRAGRQWDDKISTIEASEGGEYLLLNSGERLSLAELATLRLNWQGEERLIRFAPTR